RQGDVTRRDTDVALAGANNSRAVRSNEANTRVLFDQAIKGHRFVVGGNALGDADNEGNAALRRFEDGRRGEFGWHRDERGRGPGGVDRLLYRVEYRDSIDVSATLAGGDPANDLRAVVAIQVTVEAPLAARQAPDHDVR